MMDWTLAFTVLGLLIGMATVTWLISVIKKDVSIVDSVWSLFIFSALLLLWFSNDTARGPRAFPALVLVGIWAIRLSLHLTVRNWGHPEDRRYQTIRQHYEPMFWLKSLGIIFIFQAVLAFIIALPILPVMLSKGPLNPLDVIGMGFFVIGLLFETIADYQLMRFKSRHPGGGVLNQGLWRYSRHPNYFGEALLWWGFWIMALAAGAPYWMILSPALMTWLLVKFSGVPLLESDLKARRPDYLAYIESTSSFIPRRPRQKL
jgi:steroid 5-alpha reductase family enzyme